jgi:Na+/proline symporter
VITALCTLVMYGGAVREGDPGINYVRAMVDLLPGGLRGLMLASFVAAFSSTQATQMNWGSSYLVNDLYRRFIKRDASERHYVLAARLATALTLVLSLIATQFMDQISHAWHSCRCSAPGRTGLRPALVLGRVNAWSEVSAMARRWWCRRRCAVCRWPVAGRLSYHASPRLPRRSG